MDPVIAVLEVTGFIEDIENAISKLDKWTQPESSPVPIAVVPGKARLLKEPYGVILIISPWNYPISLITRPLIGAIAAGNAVIIKPSEISQHVEKVISEIFPKYLDSHAVRIVNGGPTETQALLKEKFDKICYTGSTNVGRLVMKAAAENLTPVLLELGGKSPVIIDKNTPLDKAVPRIIWGKFLNAGQTCIAPDYALVHKDKYDEFLLEAQKVIERFWGKNPQESQDYGRIISKSHVRRLKDMIDTSGTIVMGGKVDESDRYISPTLITNPPPDSTIMKEEIFGPLFPILPIQNLEEAIAFINERPKPLALYVFTPDPAAATFVLSNTSSGGAAVNETVLHNICRGLPFGGVGESGMGSYNGKYSFDEFCHLKGVLYRDLNFDMSVRYPPFTQQKLTNLKRLLALGNMLPLLKKVGMGLVVVTVGVVLGWFAY